MPLPDQTPKLPKLPFLIGDAALLAAAWLIAAQAAHPLPIEETLAIVGCVVCAALVGCLPFLTDYARRQDEALDDRQRGLEALARTVAASAEQISIATQGLHELATGGQKMQEKMTELRAASAARVGEKQKAEKELAAGLAAKAERLEAVAEQIAKGAADWVKADAAFQKMVATLEKLPARAGTQRTEEKKPEVPKWESEPEPLPAPVADEPAADSAATPSLPLDIPPPVAVAKAPRKPRKPRVQVAPEPKAPDSDSPGEAAAAAASAPSEFSQVSPDEAAPPPAVSADGATRLLVTAYIGIGNRLFIRGDGPGLSWEKGVPLQFISIGKWRWETAEAAAPIKFKLYKNDEIECAELGESTLKLGRQRELNAGF